MESQFEQLGKLFYRLQAASTLVRQTEIEIEELLAIMNKGQEEPKIK